MNCENCGRPAALFVVIQSAQVPLCIDCNLKLMQATAIHHELIVGPQDDIWARTASATELQSLYQPYAQKTGQIGETTFNNITVSDTAIGSIKKMYISAVDLAISVLGDSGDQVPAEAFRGLTEAIASNSTQLSIQDKEEMLELLSVLARGTMPPRESHRSKDMLAVAEKLATLITGVASLSELCIHHLYQLWGSSTELRDRFQQPSIRVHAGASSPFRASDES